MHSTRRQFLGSVALFGAALFGSRALVACAAPQGDDREPVGESEAALGSCQVASISNNHNHSLVVPPADVEAGVAKTYSIRGTSSHDHTVAVTAEDFDALRAGTPVVLVSSVGGAHTHTVTVRCGGASDAGADADATGDASADGATAPSCDGATSSVISVNHGHSLSVPREDVLAGETRTYSIKGTSSHPHDVTITAAQFAQIRAGGSVTITSTSVGMHTHAVTVVCA